MLEELPEFTILTQSMQEYVLFYATSPVRLGRGRWWMPSPPAVKMSGWLFKSSSVLTFP